MVKTVWGVIFFLGAVIFAWLEWHSPHGANSWLWFMETSLWSGACGIGYTINDWYLRKN